MKKEVVKEEYCCSDVHSCAHHPRSLCSAVYGLGFIGSAVYYVSQTSGFWLTIIAILKAAVWPAFLVYNIFRFVGM